MKARTLLAAACASALLGSAIPALAAGPHDAAAQVTKNPFLKAGIRLYNDLEFNAALEQLHRAESYPGNTLDDAVLVHTYEGIVQFESNNRPAAETEFSTALALDLNAQLPQNVSPKISDAFEAMRTKLQKEKVVVAPPQPDGSRTGVTHPPDATNPPAGGLTASTVKPQTSKSQVAPWVLLGSAAVLGGVGTVFAVHARGQGTDAQNAAFQDEADASLSGAKGSAVVAYVALGAAVAAAATCVTLFVLDHNSDSQGAGGEAR